MNLPNLIIIGAMKAATTSLHYYLNLHPQISMSKEKELNFFVKERNWKKGLEWYKSNFNGDTTLRGETSPLYTSFPLVEDVPDRMYSIIPEAKLIYLVRDPIQRIISHYIHKVADGGESRRIEDALSCLTNNPYVCRSQYFMQLENYLRFFPETNILIISSEELGKENRKTMSKIFNFLHVDSTFYSDNFGRLLHKSNRKRRKHSVAQHVRQRRFLRHLDELPFSIRSHADWLLFYAFSKKVKKPVLSKDLNQRLLDFLHDDISQLKKFTGYKFADWCL